MLKRPVGVTRRQISASTARRLRLPLRASAGSVNLILGCSGELTGKVRHEADCSCEIITVVAQEFFDAAPESPGGTRASNDRRR
jgi:hypothetical protein